MSRMPIDRRRWLAASALALMAARRAAAADDPVEAVKAKGRAARMDPFEAFESDGKHFVAVGDAPRTYCLEALKVCEAVAADYRKAFKDKGFELAWPGVKMVVVVLAGPQSYAAFEGGFVDEAVGGHYDLGSNRLVTFDFRARDPRSKAGAIVPQEDNTLALVHETTHLLTYNTGLLDPKADVPKAISEGLATYGETWRPRNRGAIGANNLRRLQGFRSAARPDGGTPWIALERLIADDKAFDDPATQQVAYFEAWRLVHRMLGQVDRADRFRAYLEALKGATDPARRIAVAAEHLGDLGKLDKDLRPAGSVSRGRG